MEGNQHIENGPNKHSNWKEDYRHFYDWLSGIFMTLGIFIPRPVSKWMCAWQLVNPHGYIFELTSADIRSYPAKPGNKAGIEQYSVAIQGIWVKNDVFWG